MLRSAYILVFTAFLFLVSPVAAQQNGSNPLLIPIGSGISNNYADVTRAAIAQSGQADINILILPSTLAFNEISDINTSRSWQPKYPGFSRIAAKAGATIGCRVFIVRITRPDAYIKTTSG
jgi:hypothetical protein